MCSVWMWPQLNKHLKEIWGLVEPVQKVLGTGFDSRRNKTTGTFDQVILTDMFAYVPILDTLKSILQTCLRSGIFPVKVCMQT